MNINLIVRLTLQKYNKCLMYVQLDSDVNLAFNLLGKIYFFPVACLYHPRTHIHIIGPENNAVDKD